MGWPAMTATTPTPLTAARIEEIRGRLTPVVAAHGDKWKAVPWHVTEGPPEVRVERDGAKDYLLCCPVYDIDAAFIAAAPADIAALLAEVERLQERHENAAQAASETHRDWESRCYAILAALDLDFGDPPPVDSLLAEVERLQPRWRPEAEWHDDLGPVLWARYPVDEPPYVGTPGDTDWIGDYYTHFCALPAVDEDLQARAALGEDSSHG